MSTLAIHFTPLARNVQFDDDVVQVILANGREIRAPLVWFPHLHTATGAQRNHWELIGGGAEIHFRRKSVTTAGRIGFLPGGA